MQCNGLEKKHMEKDKFLVRPYMTLDLYSGACFVTIIAGLRDVAASATEHPATYGSALCAQLQDIHSTCQSKFFFCKV